MVSVLRSKILKRLRGASNPYEKGVQEGDVGAYGEMQTVELEHVVHGSGSRIESKHAWWIEWPL